MLDVPPSQQKLPKIFAKIKESAPSPPVCLWPQRLAVLRHFHLKLVSLRHPRALAATGASKAAVAGLPARSLGHQRTAWMVGKGARSQQLSWLRWNGEHGGTQHHLLIINWLSSLNYIINSNVDMNNSEQYVSICRDLGIEFSFWSHASPRCLILVTFDGLHFPQVHHEEDGYGSKGIQPKNWESQFRKLSTLWLYKSIAASILSLTHMTPIFAFSQARQSDTLGNNHLQRRECQRAAWSWNLVVLNRSCYLFVIPDLTGRMPPKDWLVCISKGLLYPFCRVAHSRPLQAATWRFRPRMYHLRIKGRSHAERSAPANNSCDEAALNENLAEIRPLFDFSERRLGMAFQPQKKDLMVQVYYQTNPSGYASQIGIWIPGLQGWNLLLHLSTTFQAVSRLRGMAYCEKTPHSEDHRWAEAIMLS